MSQLSACKHYLSSGLAKNSLRLINDIQQRTNNAKILKILKFLVFVLRYVYYSKYCYSIEHKFHLKLWPSPPPPFLALGTEAYVCVLLLFFWIHKLLYTFIGPDVIVKPFLCNYIWLIQQSAECLQKCRVLKRCCPLACINSHVFVKCLAIVILYLHCLEKHV